MDPSFTASLDFETGSLADLKKVGAFNYAEHPSTRIICLAWQLPGEGVQAWWEGQPDPRGLLDWVASGSMVSGWNVTFEWLIWNRVLFRQFPGWKAPGLLLEQTVDTMASAANQGLPLSLDMAAGALPKLGVQKDKDGHALMMRMSRPRAVLAGGALEWWDQMDPARLARLVEYCKQDVRTERAILGALPALRDAERRVWLWDARAMDRGIGFDRTLAEQMEVLANGATAQLDARMKALTGGEVPNTRAVSKLLTWVQGLEPRAKSLGKDQLAAWIGKTQNTLLKEVLAVRQAAAKSSVAKLKSMAAWASGPRAGDRMRGLTTYYGAFRTGRWAGRGPQVQNYPRGNVWDTDLLSAYVLANGDPEGFDLLFGVDVLDGLSSILRGCLIPRAGKKLASVDFAQIEARVLAWLAGDRALLEVFLSGKDVYIVAASRIFGVREENVTKAQRQIGKVAVLALGYQGGAGAFVSMAKNYGLIMDEADAEQIKVDWREGNPLIVKLWWAVQDAAMRAMTTPGKVFRAGRCEFMFTPGDGHFKVQLPSGRKLVYRDAEVRVGGFGKDVVSYMGVDQYTRQWTRIDTYGGKLVENITQAVARDLMASAFLRVSEGGHAALATVHDELLVEVDGEAEFREVERKMLIVPPWAAGLPVGADGWFGDRYRK
jgi:DNA polymerase bacteriophage-type